MGRDRRGLIAWQSLLTKALLVMDEVSTDEGVELIESQLVSDRHRCSTTRAGTPTTVLRGGTSDITTAPAPTMASSPTVTRLMTTAPVWTWAS